MEPATTVDCGELTTATTTSSTPSAVSSDCTASAGSSTDAIAADPAMVSINFERRQITLMPSSSDRAPETTAAADSPIEWPITAPGMTP